MTERDSTRSSDNNKNNDSNTINTTPNLLMQTEKDNENTHAYFIPLVMMIVLGVVVVATFYSKEFNNLVADILPSDQADKHASEVRKTMSASTEGPHEPKDSSESLTINETTAVKKVSNKSATKAVELKASDSTIKIVDTSSSEVSADQALSAQSPDVASLDDQVSYPDRQSRDTRPYASSMTFATPEPHLQGYIQMMEERRRSYEKAQQARRERMIKIHEYRNVVMKRIEQDRQDMYKRPQEIERKSRIRRDQLMNRLEQTEKHSSHRPI